MGNGPKLSMKYPISFSLDAGKEVIERLKHRLDRKLGVAFRAVVAYHTKEALGGKGFEAIWDAPGKLYTELARFFGSEKSADIVITAVLKVVAGERGRKVAGEFIRAMKRDCVQKVRAILKELLLYEQREGEEKEHIRSIIS